MGAGHFILVVVSVIKGISHDRDFQSTLAMQHAIFVIHIERTYNYYYNLPVV